MEGLHMRTIIAAMLLLALSIQLAGCVPTKKPQDIAAQSGPPTEIAQSEKPILGFGTLVFGITETEAMKHLPWALTEKEVSKSWDPKDSKTHFVYGEGISPQKWDLLRGINLAPEASMYFILGFTDKGLGYISITLPAGDIDDAAFKTILQRLSHEYGTKMEEQRQPPESLVRLWQIHRDNADVYVSRPKDNEGLAYIILATPYGWETASKVIDQALGR
jgi:hypothetical protein